jgi:hypothetical protein
MNNPKLALHKQLANPSGLYTQDIKPAPNPGDKIIITDYRAFTKEEVRDLIKIYDHVVTIEEVDPIPVGENGDYHWEYSVYIKEFKNVHVLVWHYKLK